jgi:DNA-binding LacI/PurR family transcriptional regulator
MALAAAGYATVISNSDEDAELQGKLVASMIEHGVDAVVICPAYGERPFTFEPLARAGIPTLQVLRKMDPRTELFPFASFDYAAGSAEATRHLIGLGARRIAFVGGLDERSDHARSGRRVTLDALSEAGLSPLRLPGTTSRAFGLSAAATLFASIRTATPCSASTTSWRWASWRACARGRCRRICHPRRRLRRYRGLRAELAAAVLGFLRYRRLRAGHGGAPGTG